MPFPSAGIGGLFNPSLCAPLIAWARTIHPLPLLGFREAEAQRLSASRHGQSEARPYVSLSCRGGTGRLKRNPSSRRTVLRHPVQCRHLKRVGLLGIDQRPDR
jgi:hypothetical protein